MVAYLRKHTANWAGTVDKAVTALITSGTIQLSVCAHQWAMQGQFVTLHRNTVCTLSPQFITRRLQRQTKFTIRNLHIAQCGNRPTNKEKQLCLVCGYWRNNDVTIHWPNLCMQCVYVTFTSCFPVLLGAFSTVSQRFSKDFGIPKEQEATKCCTMYFFSVETQKMWAE